MAANGVNDKNGNGFNPTWLALIRLLVWGDETEDAPGKEILTKGEIAKRVGISRQHLTKLLHHPRYAEFQALLHAAQAVRDRDLHMLSGRRLRYRFEHLDGIEIKELISMFKESKERLPVQPIEQDVKHDLSESAREHITGLIAGVAARLREGGDPGEPDGGAGEEPAA